MKTAESPPDLVITYEDPPAAQRAVRSLERAGVEGGDITLLGTADEPSRKLHNVARDERVLGYIFRSAVIGGAVGMVAGGALGMAVGTLAFAWLTGGMWAVAAGAAVLGAGLGILVGGIVRLPQSNAGLATIETAVAGPVTIGVHRAGPDLRVEHHVEATGPQAVEPTDDDVRRVQDAPPPAAATPALVPAIAVADDPTPRSGARRLVVLAIAATLVGATVLTVHRRRR